MKKKDFKENKAVSRKPQFVISTDTMRLFKSNAYDGEFRNVKPCDVRGMIFNHSKFENVLTPFFRRVQTSVLNLTSK